ncbi:MAG TPA: polyketide synthase, partial [Rhodopila sp.]|uniref:beta-ketoacyl [acyl carrier protein] synthase domain-containing protein n=1 Tax=Rhodopila sp. TaxID=2480087 RepID=UPI002C8FB10A
MSDTQAALAASVARERQALSAIRTLRARLEEAQRTRSEPIAIVGMSCRFPGGATDPDSYWRMLSDKVDAVRPIPPERMDVAAIFDPDHDAPGKTYSRWAGMLDGVDQFDADFFGISPREAAITDPQQRLFLEGAWLALEHAGIAPSGLSGSATGVFAGVTTAEYARLHDRIVAPEDLSPYSTQGLSINTVSGRVSYTLGLQGPSMVMDTACSSSLVAIDRACRSLRDEECGLAIAGGVNVLAVPEGLIAGSRLGMFAADGRCKAFSAGADGFVRGEGCGVVVLKRLGDAVRDGDRVLAVIRGSAVNHDGPSSGLTVPNGLAQQALIRRALKASGVSAAEVGY